MARNLYRFYLYAVFLMMLIFAAVGLGWLLQPLLSLTALRGMYSQPPANMALVQGVVFFGISWIIAGLFGGLHYWLIRRDMLSDPDAGNQGVRSFFLNVGELISAPIGIGLAAGGVIGQLGQPYDLSYQAAIALAVLALFAVLELERRRCPVSSGVALFFQRLHLYGVQFILLNILVFTWISAFSLLVNIVAFNGQAYGGGVPCVGFVPCSNGPNLFSTLASALWMVLFWLGYGWLARHDRPSLFRRIMLALSFAYGVGLLLNGVYFALALLFRNAFGAAPSAADTLSSYNFVPYITLGLLVCVVYLFWLLLPAKQPAERMAVALLCQAVIAALMAVAFFWGIAYALLNVLELPATAVDWAAAVSLCITGAAYIVFDVRLSHSKRENAAGAIDARRGFVFALLGVSILASAIGGAVGLYAWITALLGSPLDNWPHVSHIGAAAFIVGAAVLAFYLWRAFHEQFIGGRRRAERASVGVPASPAVTDYSAPPAALLTEPVITLAVPPAEATVAPQDDQAMSIEDILDDLLAGKVTRDQAAARIRELSLGVGH